MADPKVRTVVAKRVQFHEPVLNKQKRTPRVSGWPTDGYEATPFEVALTPVGIERDGVLVPWATVVAIDLATEDEALAFMSAQDEVKSTVPGAKEPVSA